MPDDERLATIPSALTDSLYMGKGHRKVHARLRYRGIHADIERVRLLMRDHGLQAPGRPRRNLGPGVHEGTITTQRHDEMWGTDATNTLFLNGQQARILGACDHCACELMVIHASIEGYATLDDLNQAHPEVPRPLQPALTH